MGRFRLRTLGGLFFRRAGLPRFLHIGATPRPEIHKHFKGACVSGFPVVKKPVRVFEFLAVGVSFSFKLK